MNIIVKTRGGKVTVRPDTTWEKDSEDFYPPEFVNGISYTPVLFARVSKPGRSVGRNFSARYFDSVGYGVLLYPEDMLDGSEEAFACASCLDHTSFLPYPAEDRSMLGQNKEFRLSRAIDKNEDLLFTHDAADSGTIEDLISEVTRFIYIRTGDLIAVELDARRHLCSREDGTVSVITSLGGHGSLDFNIVF